MTVHLDVSRPALGGYVDRLEIDSAGLIRIVGWLKTAFDSSQIPIVSLEGVQIPFLQQFRFVRSDVPPEPQTPVSQAGLVLEYLVPESMIGKSLLALSVDLHHRSVLHFELTDSFLNPHYRSLLSSSEVLHRADIYGSGPPNITAHPEVLELASKLPGPVLDFGCGRGTLVAHLRQLGIEAHGLELESQIIRNSLPAERADWITFYDGSFPSPFRDRSFRSAVCSEVLEHIPDYQAAIRDIARIVTGQVLFTVPDLSAIPIGFPHGVVPWHLLEGTHVNFFNQQSLAAALEPYFSRVEFGRVGAALLGDSAFYVSLAVVCTND